jgi:hypothetical protein
MPAFFHKGGPGGKLFLGSALVDMGKAGLYPGRNRPFSRIAPE